MKIDEQQVQKIADLSKLEFNEDEIADFAQKLSHILDFVEKMNQYSTADIEPMAHPLDVSQPLRDDEVTEPNVRERIMELAPESSAGLFLVPQVIEDQQQAQDQ